MGDDPPDINLAQHRPRSLRRGRCSGVEGRLYLYNAA